MGDPALIPEVLNQDEYYMEPAAPGFIRCHLCGKQFKFMTESHLQNKHGIPIGQYQEMFPEALMKATPIEQEIELERITYVDVHGNLRYKDTNELINDQEIIDKFDINKFQDMENDFRYLAMHKSKKVLEWLDSIINYKPAKGTKNILYSPANQLKAAELILGYGPPKAAQRKEVNTTIKRLDVKISGSLPKGFSEDDF